MGTNFDRNLSEQIIVNYLVALDRREQRAAERFLERFNSLERYIPLRMKELYWTLSRESRRAGHALFPQAIQREKEEERSTEPSWRPVDAPNPEALLTLKRPRLLLDMTSTLRSGKRTGIQRVVREIAQNGWMMGEGVPVAIHDGALLPYYNSPRLAGAVEIEEGDILLLLDATWNHLEEYLPIIDEVKGKGGNALVCLYDILPLSYPSAFPPELVERFSAWMEKVVVASDGVIADSRAAAESLRDYLRAKGRGTPGLPIGWWRLGDDFSCACSGEPTSVARRIVESGRPFFLGVGTVEPRKGYPVVVDALERIWSEGVDASYVIVGGAGWGMRQFERRIERHAEFNRRLFWLKSASDADLALLYRNARAMVLASVAEGFGLPIVEAARYGAPVIATDIPVFREAAGDGAHYFRLLDCDNLVEKMRDALAEKLPAPLLNSFSWQESAAQLFSLARKRQFEMTIE